MKYESPLGSGNRVYFPPGVGRGLWPTRPKELVIVEGAEESSGRHSGWVPDPRSVWRLELGTQAPEESDERPGDRTKEVDRRPGQDPLAGSSSCHRLRLRFGRRSPRVEWARWCIAQALTKHVSRRAGR